jgi:hypothetical protein
MKSYVGTISVWLQARNDEEAYLELERVVDLTRINGYEAATDPDRIHVDE